MEWWGSGYYFQGRKVSESPGASDNETQGRLQSSGPHKESVFHPQTSSPFPNYTPLGEWWARCLVGSPGQNCSEPHRADLWSPGPGPWLRISHPGWDCVAARGSVCETPWRLSRVSCWEWKHRALSETDSAWELDTNASGSSSWGLCLHNSYPWSSWHSCMSKGVKCGHWREPDIAVQWKQLLLCAHDSVLLYRQRWAECVMTTSDWRLWGVVTHFMATLGENINRYVTVRPGQRHPALLCNGQKDACQPSSLLCLNKIKIHPYSWSYVSAWNESRSDPDLYQHDNHSFLWASLNMCSFLS